MPKESLSPLEVAPPIPIGIKSRMREGDALYARIDDKEQALYQQIVLGGKNHDPVTDVPALLSQYHGLRHLALFLDQQETFGNVAPFILSTSGRKFFLTNAGAYSLTYKFPSIANTPPHILNITLPNSMYSNVSDKILAVPRTLSKGRNQYYWLEYYTLVNDEDKQFFYSSRLMPESKQHKTDSLWHGIEEEVLADYIEENNSLQLSDCFPIDIEFIKGLPSLYTLAGRQNLKIVLHDVPERKMYNRLLILPNQDITRKYQWLDIFKHKRSLANHPPELITTYRIIKEDKRITAKNWFGPERRAVEDYINRTNNITVEDLQPIYSVVTNKGYIPISKETLFYHPENLAVGEQYVLIPKYYKNDYVWFELYKIDPLTRKPIGNIISTARLLGNKLDRIEWNGLEAQLLKDVINGEKEPDELLPVALVTNKSHSISVLRKDNKKIYLVISQSWNLPPGTDLVLVPQNDQNKDNNKNLIFILCKGQTQLGRYTYHHNSEKFTLEKNILKSLKDGEDHVTAQEATDFISQFLIERE